MIVRDANANFFIVFGGLFSRRCIETLLRNPARLLSPSPTLLSELSDLNLLMASGSGVREVSRLQPQIKKIILAANRDWSVRTVGKTGDLVCEFNSIKMLVETKVQNKDRLDEAAGSGTAYAEDQLLRDLKEREIDWGILTNGWSWRLYHRNYPHRMLEFSVADMVKDGSIPNELKFFFTCIQPTNFLNSLISESDLAKKYSAKTLAKSLRELFVHLLDAGWDKDVAVRFILRLCAHRFLEDCGIIDTLNPKYGNKCLGKEENIEKQKDFLNWVLNLWKEVAGGKWTTPSKPGEKIPPLSGDFITASEVSLLNSQKKIKSLASIVASAFFVKGQAIDCSDLEIEFFGNLYQIVEDPTSKNEAGRYFTSFELSKELASYLSERFSLRETLKDGEFILDPACGSGQLLRLLIPFAMEFIEFNPRFPTKLHHWRKFAEHLAGLDVDNNCVWITKISLSLATAAKGCSFVDLNIRKKDVIESCIGKSRGKYSEALGFKDDQKVVAIITNPPWEECRIQFPTYYKRLTGKSRPSQRNEKPWQEYEKFRRMHKAKFEELVGAQEKINIKIRQSFSIRGIPNLAEVFFRICRDLLIATTEQKSRNNLPYAIIMPDQFFIGTRMKIRDQALQEFDYYIPFPRNEDPITHSRYFYGVDPNRRFGIVLGKVNQRRDTTVVHAKPLGANQFSIPYKKLSMLPLSNSAAELLCLAKILEKRDPRVSNCWQVGEWDGTTWANVKSREKVTKTTVGAMPLIKAEQLSEEYGLKFQHEAQILWWVKSEQRADLVAASNSRIIVGDTKRNAGKIVMAGFIEGNSHKIGSYVCKNGVALQNKLIYSSLPKDWLCFINSIFFDLAMRAIAGASNLNAWRFNFLGLPQISEEKLKKISGLKYSDQQIEIGRFLGISDDQIWKCTEDSLWLKNSDREEIREALKLPTADDLLKQAEELEKNLARRKRKRG